MNLNLPHVCFELVHPSLQGHAASPGPFCTKAVLLQVTGITLHHACHV